MAASSEVNRLDTLLQRLQDINGRLCYLNDAVAHEPSTAAAAESSQADGELKASRDNGQDQSRALTSETSVFENREKDSLTQKPEATPHSLPAPSRSDPAQELSQRAKSDYFSSESKTPKARQLRHASTIGPTFAQVHHRHCRRCGNQVLDDAIFCRRCGSRVEDANDGAPVRVRPFEAASFNGEDLVNTSFTDFDLVFIFKNPGHIDEFGELKFRQSSFVAEQSRAASGKRPANLMATIEQGVRRKSSSYHRASPGNSAAKRDTRDSIQAFEEEEGKEELKFKTDLIARENRRHQGSGPRVMLRCSNSKCHEPLNHELGKKVLCPKCGFPAEELMKQCQRCFKKVHYDTGMCAYCRSTDLRVKVFPMVSTPEEMKPEVVSFYTEELIRDFFTDPRQGDLCEISRDIESLAEARRAIVDIFLSFFRAQKEEHYFSYLFKSVDFDELFLCVKMTDQTARMTAETEQLYCALDTEQMTKPLEEGGMHIKYERVGAEFMCCNSWQTKIVGWFRGIFDREENYVRPEMLGGLVQYQQHPGLERLLFKRPEECDVDKHSFLTKCDRIRLLYDRVTDVMEVQDMIKWGLLTDFFPLHTKEALTNLKNSWARVGLCYKYAQPINDVQNYFGPHIALYFVFLEAFLKYSIILVVVSILFYLICLFTEFTENWKDKDQLNFYGGKSGVPELRIVWALMIIIWCSVFQIRLKRNIATKMNLWGLDKEGHSTVKAELNPRFVEHASIIESELNENDLAFDVPPDKRSSGRIFSSVITVIYVSIGIIITLLILRAQAGMINSPQKFMRDNAHYMSFVLTIEIKILNGVWLVVGQWLVDHEYWKERLEYDNSMAYKNFWVQWVSTFASFYWIAFGMIPFKDDSYKSYGEHADTPWQYLTYQMIYTFGLYLVFSVYDLLSPIITLWWSRRSERQALVEIGEQDWKYSFIELQTKMIEYDGDLQNDDYMQILLPYGFVLYFGATLPISALFCWIYTTVQLRVDAWKLCHTMRRPYPRTTRPGAWVWEELIDVFLRLAAFTNIGLVSFVLKPIRIWHLPSKLAVFFSLLLAVNLLNGVLLQIFPTESDKVVLAQKRHEYQKEKAQKMFAEHHDQASYMKLRANKQMKFDQAVARCRLSTYKSKNHDVELDWSLVDKIFEPEPEFNFWGVSKTGDAENSNV
mmetsp:Transcript_57486/g.100689  ORF Transcript_57486/g.100689 Transcript_57486/m.100689 type:complete len:1164 (-) Transcript_57486:119-3610(-)